MGNDAEGAARGIESLATSRREQLASLFLIVVGLFLLAGSAHGVYRSRGAAAWAVPPLGATALIGGKPRVLLLHAGHEGSHAICEAVGQQACVLVDCSERFDAYINHGRTNWAGVAASNASVVLVRGTAWETDAMTSAGTPVIIVRTDMMRWALSRYHKVLLQKYGEKLPAGVSKDPQFAHGNTGESHLSHYDLDKLKLVVGNCHREWSRKVDLMRLLAAEGVPFHIAIYERFLADGDEYAARIATAAGRSTSSAGNGSNGGRECTGKMRGKSVHRVHSHNISTFVSNELEVLRFFAAADPELPSWEQMAAAFHDRNIN